MQLNPNLVFNGHCEEAFTNYAKILGGNIGFMMKWGDSPMADRTPENWRDKVIHATIMFNQQTISGGDAPPGQYEKPQGMWLQVNVPEQSEAERIFSLLSDRGAVHMPLQETFWASRFGMLVDRFGIPWMINCEKHGK